MKRFFILTTLLSGLLLAAPAYGAVNIFACEPEWGALAERIGGDRVSVFVATSPRQNVHHLRAKPSLLARMRQADLVFCNGASLEAGWLPVLLQKAGRPDVQPSQSGYLLAAEHVELRNIPVTVDRSMGDVHPEGNPHLHTDPRNFLTISGVLAERLAEIDPDNASLYRDNLHHFRSAWVENISKWESDSDHLKGMNVIVYHTSWDYLLNWLDINIVASLEPKPGLPPTTSHLENILKTVNNRKVDAILMAPYEDLKAAKWLSERTGIPVLALPYTVGGNDTDSLEAVFSQTIDLFGKVK